MSEEIKELPQPDIAVESFSRSEIAAMLSIVLTKNLTYNQAAGIAVAYMYAPQLARYLVREFKKVLHPNFRDILDAIRTPVRPPEPRRGGENK